MSENLAPDVKRTPSWSVAALWSIASSLGAWLWFPTPAVFPIAFLACWVSTGLFRAFPLHKCAKIGLVGSALALGLGGSLIWYPGGLPGLTSGGRIVGGILLTTWLGISLAQCFFHALSRRFPTILGLELVVFSLPWVALFWDHREGHIGRPWALLEPTWALGLDSASVLAALGLSLGTLSILLVGARLSDGLSFQLVGGVCGLSLALFWLVPERTVIDSPSSEQTVVGRTAQRENREEDRAVATIVFSENFEPDMGTFYFRAQQSSSPWRDFGDAESTRELDYRVAEMTSTPLRLCLGEPQQVQQIELRDPDPFTQIYDIRSQVSTLTIEDLLVLDLNNPAQTKMAGGPTGRLAGEIVPPKDRRNPLLSALRVKFWLERERRQTHQAGDLKTFLFQGEPGDQKTFARAAQSLLKSLGFSTRLVHGYAVRADQRGAGSSLLITEKNRRWWNELWLEQAGWVVIDVLPLDAPLDQRTGPHDLGLQRQLGELARREVETTSPHLLPGLGVGALGLTLFLAIFCLGGYAIKLFRLTKGHTKSPRTMPLDGYRMILDRLADVGELRGPGETRREFAIRLKPDLPTLEALTLFHLEAYFSRGGAENFSESEHLVRQCLQEFRAAYPSYRRVLGSLHPFRWMKVR